MIRYRYYSGKDDFTSKDADAQDILDNLSDLILRENDVNKSLDLLKQQGIRSREENKTLKGIHDFLEEVRRLKEKIQRIGSPTPAAAEEMRRLEKLEHELRRASWGLDMDKINAQEIRDLLGEQDYRNWDSLKAMPRLLENNGLVERLEGRYVLSPKGMRQIGQKALRDIFSLLRKDALGHHETHFRGNGTSLLLDESRPYEFGDAFHLNLSQTLLNSLYRESRMPDPPGNGKLLNLRPEDFEVFQTEKRTRSAIILMLDMSGSMARDDKFFAAKKVALALHTLIQFQFPNDKLFLVGFSSFARMLKSKDLPYLNWDLDNPYTNMEEALILAKSLLVREHAPNKQIIMVSDGEPTAHLENGKVFFQFPPHPRTLARTLAEFKRCAARGINLNLFMLGQDAHLVQFVHQISKVNRGRAFYTTPNNLGRYLLVDFLSQRRKWVNM